MTPLERLNRIYSHTTHAGGCDRWKGGRCNCGLAEDYQTLRAVLEPAAGPVCEYCACGGEHECQHNAPLRATTEG